MRPATAIRRLLLPGLCLFLSCSVLEDREGCPCRLHVEVRKGCGLSPDRQVRLILSSNETALAREQLFSIRELEKEGYDTTIPKGEVHAGGYAGWRESRRDGERLIIPDGCAADSLYWVSGGTEAVGETAVLPLRIRKEHVSIELRFRFEESGTYPYYVLLRSSTAGINLADGSPVEGVFRCRPEEIEPGHFTSVLPRQLHPEDLVMEIYRKGEDHGAPLKEIPLGTLIGRSGAFSWEEEDLKDLSLFFDFAHAGIVLEIRDWELGQEFIYII